VEVWPDQRGVHDEGLRVEEAWRGIVEREWPSTGGGSMASLGGQQEPYEGEQE
jgi:hypothetical protein